VISVLRLIVRLLIYFYINFEVFQQLVIIVIILPISVLVLDPVVKDLIFLIDLVLIVAYLLEALVIDGSDVPDGFLLQVRRH